MLSSAPSATRSDTLHGWYAAAGASSLTADELAQVQLQARKQWDAQGHPGWSLDPPNTPPKTPASTVDGASAQRAVAGSSLPQVRPVPTPRQRCHTPKNCQGCMNQPHTPFPLYLPLVFQYIPHIPFAFPRLPISWQPPFLQLPLAPSQLMSATLPSPPPSPSPPTLPSPPPTLSPV